MKCWVAVAGIALVATSCGSLAVPSTSAPLASQLPVQGQARKLPGADLPGLAHHILFFDGDGDRVITLAESRHGLERLGIGRLQSAAISLVLNPILGKQASGGFTMAISVDGLLKNFKPTTTGIFGAAGRFNADRFETLFAQTDLNKDGAWDADEIDIMLKLDLIDPAVRTRTKVGFDLLLRVAGDREVVEEDRRLQAITKNRLKSFYDGNLFYEIAAKNGN